MIPTIKIYLFLSLLKHTNKKKAMTVYIKYDLLYVYSYHADKRKWLFTYYTKMIRPPRIRRIFLHTLLETWLSKENEFYELSRVCYARLVVKQMISESVGVSDDYSTGTCLYQLMCRKKCVCRVVKPWFCDSIRLEYEDYRGSFCTLREHVSLETIKNEMASLLNLNIIHTFYHQKTV